MSLPQFNVLLTILLLFINLTLFILDSCVFYFINKERDNVMERNIRSFPVYCDNLSLSPDEDVITFDGGNGGLSYTLNSEGNYICDGRNFSKTVNQLVERLSRVRQAHGKEGQQYLSCGNETLRPTSGHHSAYFKKLAKQQIFAVESSKSIVYWDKVLHIDKGIRYQNGELTITEGQTYFIYASLMINVSKREENNTTRPYRFSLRLCRRVYDYERTLLGKTALFDTGYGNVLTSLHIASHLTLRQGDILYVKVTDINHIVYGSEGNTFGIFPL